MIKKIIHNKTTMKLLFITYSLFLLNFVVIKFFGDFSSITYRINATMMNRELGWWNINLIPMKSVNSAIEAFITYGIFNIESIGVIYNIFIFIPLGVLLSITFNKIFRPLLISLLIIIGIELIQFISCLGIADIDDVLLNMIGSTIGYLLYKVPSNIYNKKKL